MVPIHEKLAGYPLDFKMLVQENRAISLLDAPMKSWHSLTNLCNNEVVLLCIPPSGGF